MAAAVVVVFVTHDFWLVQVVYFDETERDLRVEWEQPSAPVFLQLWNGEAEAQDVMAVQFLSHVPAICARAHVQT